MATKNEIIAQIEARGRQVPKSWRKGKMLQRLNEIWLMPAINIDMEWVNPGCSWATAEDYLPLITIDQTTRTVNIKTQETKGMQDFATIETQYFTVIRSYDGVQILVSGKVCCKNLKRRQCSGEKEFCCEIYVGDSLEIQMRRVPATATAMSAHPNDTKNRLRKLGELEG